MKPRPLKPGSDVLQAGIDHPDAALSPAFFTGSTLEVARSLLGVILHRRLPDGSLCKGAIVEVEAYTQDDPACHAFKGRTRRCQVMFGPPGFSYVYFIYGMYHCLNVVTEAEGQAGAVLIRAVAGEGTSGPGRLCRQWSIDRSHNGLDLRIPDSPLWLTAGSPVQDEDVLITPRIGLSVGTDRLWRFAVKGHPAVSGPKVVRAEPRRRRSRSGDGGRN